jgi:fluoride exporter
VVNTSGCLLIGILLVVVLEITQPHPLVRPFLGTGVLGGHTTFSTASVDVQQLIDAGHAALALTYLGATLGAALLATWSGMTAARLADRLRRPMRRPPHARSGS